VIHIFHSFNDFQLYRPIVKLEREPFFLLSGRGGAIFTHTNMLMSCWYRYVFIVTDVLFMPSWFYPVENPAENTATSLAGFGYLKVYIWYIRKGLNVLWAKCTG